MPKSSKPVVCICGSRSIQILNLDFYLNQDYFGEIVSGGANGVDSLVEKQVKSHGIEWICFLPQYKIYGGKYGPIKRNEDMVNYYDEVIVFWDGKSPGTDYTIKYTIKMGRKVNVHIIEDLEMMCQTCGA